MHKKGHVLSPWKNSTNQFHMENEWGARVIKYWRQLYSWVPPQILVPICTNQNRLATSHLKYVKCPIFLAIYIYAKNFLKTKECPNVNWTVNTNTKGRFYINVINISLFTKINIFDSLYWSGHRWSDSTPSYELPTQQNMTTSHFIIFFKKKRNFGLH